MTQGDARSYNIVTHFIDHKLYEMITFTFVSNTVNSLGLVTHMALEILVNTGSGNGLLPDGTKPLREPMLTYSQ